MTKVMPTIFFGHGNPMNALAKNAYTEGWQAIGKSISRPKAVLAISAHWYIPNCAVTRNAFPTTIHDFGGFPKELFEVQYPAPGCMDLAKRVQAFLGINSVTLDEGWGLDHGTWSVMMHVFPDADIPIVQLSIDKTKPPEFHYKLGNRLKTLREEGVLVIGSGNIVHNLAAYAWDNPGIDAFDWAIRFEEHVKTFLKQGDDEALLDYQRVGREAMLSVPTPEHYLPLLYMLGLRESNEPVSFPVNGFEGGAISMLTVRFG